MLQHLSEIEAPIVKAGLVDLDGSFIFIIGLFLVFFAVLHTVIIKPMMKAHELRYSKMEGARIDAEAMDLKAAEAATGYEGKLDEARQSSVGLRDALAEEGVAEARDRVASERAVVDAGQAKAAAAREALLKSASSEMDTRANELADAIVARLIGKAGG